MEPNVNFVEFDATRTQHVDALRRTLSSRIEPLYGNQDTFVEKVINEIDRKCLLLFKDDNPIGLLIYKTHPSSEYKQYGIEESFEIKTLVLIDPAKDSGKGYGQKLIQKVFELAKLGSFKSIHVTVCKKQTDSFHFFKKYEFNEVTTLFSKFRETVDEALFHKII